VSCSSQVAVYVQWQESCRSMSFPTSD